MLSIIVVNYNSENELVRLLESISLCINMEYEVLVWDNSPQPLRVKLPANTKYSHSSENLGYGTAINRSVIQSNGEFLLLLNPDVILRSFPDDPGSLFVNNVAVIGAVQGWPEMKTTTVFRFRSLQSALIELLFLEGRFLRKSFRELLSPEENIFVQGSCMLVRKTDFQVIRGFDEQFFMYEEEADFCKRIWAGGQCCEYNEAIRVDHEIGASTPSTLFNIQNVFIGQNLFVRKHYSRMYFYLYLTLSYLGKLSRCAVYAIAGFFASNPSWLEKAKIYFVVGTNNPIRYSHPD